MREASFGIYYDLPLLRKEVRVSGTKLEKFPLHLSATLVALGGGIKKRIC